MYFLSHVCNPNNIQKVEETGQYAEGQPELHNKFQANLECIAKPCLKKEKPPKEMKEHVFISSSFTLILKLFKVFSCKILGNPLCPAGYRHHSEYLLHKRIKVCPCTEVRQMEFFTFKDI